VAARPAPPARKRSVVCPHCERSLETDEKAISVVCRHCSKRVIVEDMRIDAYHGVVRLATAGRIEVGKTGHVSAKVRARELVVFGTVRGEVVALDRVEVAATGKVFADVSTPRLSIEPGAVLVGRVEVGPRAGPAPAPPEPSTGPDEEPKAEKAPRKGRPRAAST
jgi:cytoskeletal protein CcmA (bactofilin family)/DNA-directed RNA polymerase subunit RPC12/RpoP